MVFLGSLKFLLCSWETICLYEQLVPVNPPGVYACDLVFPGFFYSFLHLASLKNLYQNSQNYKTVIYDSQR